MSKRRDWTDKEQQAICAAYVGMLLAEATGQRFNKSQIRRELIGSDENPGPLNARSNGSVEAKFMNVSAAAIAIGLPIVRGYKPATNYQASLRVHLAEAYRHVEGILKHYRHIITERAESC